MNSSQLLFENQIQTMLVVLIVLISCKYVCEIYEYFKIKMIRRSATKKSEIISDQVAKIEYVSEAQIKSVEQITKAIQEINKRLDQIEKRRIKDAIGYNRALILQMYDRLKDKDKLTAGEYEAFSEVSHTYLEAGGNSVFKNKIIPDILSKTVMKNMEN